MRIKTKKRIGKDKKAESVMYPFVLILALVVILGYMIWGISQYGQAGEISQGNYPGLTRPFGLTNYTTIHADSDDPRYCVYGDLEGYNVSDDDVLDYVPYPTDEEPFIFYDDDGDYKYIHIIRNNRDYNPESTDMWEMYLDFIAIRRHTYAFDWDPQWNNAIVPFTVIEDNWSDLTNVSVSEFQLSGSQDNLFVNATTGLGAANFTSDLWGNDFRIFYGWSLFRLDELDFWGAIAMVIYADIPGIDPTVTFMFHAFVTGTIIFVVFTMALRMIPFLGD